MVAAAVYAAVLFWAVTADTGFGWTVFVLVNAAVIVLALALLARRRRRSSLPAGAAMPRTSADGVYRPLVIIDADGAVPRLREELVRSAAGRPAEAFVVALEAAGIGAQAQIGAHDPLQAATDGLREFAAETIVVVTGSETTWLEDGLLETLERRSAIPSRDVVVD